MGAFLLDKKLAADSQSVTVLGLCQMRLMNDSRWPWLVLIPQRPAITEVFELTPLDQTIMTFETALAAKALKNATGCAKINVGSLGNIVDQLHFHIVARNPSDPAWPGPVWGHGRSVGYDPVSRKSLINAIVEAL